MIGFDFIIFGKAALKAEPGEGSLHDPPLGLDDEGVAGEIGALDDFQRESSPGNDAAQYSEQIRSAIGGVGPDFAQPSEGHQHSGEKQPCAFLVGKVGGGDKDAQDHSHGIHDHMPLSSHNLLSSIEATVSGVVSLLNTLRVDNRSGGGFFFPLFWRTASRNCV